MTIEDTALWRCHGKYEKTIAQGLILITALFEWRKTLE
jgi:hypothetical protein